MSEPLDLLPKGPAAQAQVFTENMGEPTGVSVFTDDASQPVDPEASARRAHDAALSRISDSTNPDIFQGYFDLYHSLDLQIQAGQGELINEQAQLSHLQNSTSSLPFLKSAAPGLESDVISQLFAERTTEQPVAQSAIETLLDSMELGSEDERAIYRRALQDGNFIENRSRIYMRQAMVAQALEDLAPPEERHWLKYAADFVLLSITFYDSAAGSGIYEDATLGDRILRGQTTVDGLSAFYSMSDEEFTQEYVNDTVRKLQSAATTFGYRNKLFENVLVQELTDRADKNFINFFNAVDNFPLMAAGALKGIKGAKNLGKSLTSVGNKTTAADAYARILREGDEKGLGEVATKLGTEFDDIDEALTPSGLNRDPSVENDKVGIPAAQRYQMGKEFSEFLNLNKELLSRLAPQEFEEAVAAKVKELKSRPEFKGRIVDWTIETRTDASGISSPVLLVDVGTRKGGAWANTNSAVRFLQDEGFDPEFVQMVPGSRAARPVVDEENLDFSEFIGPKQAPVQSGVGFTRDSTGLGKTGEKFNQARENRDTVSMLGELSKVPGTTVEELLALGRLRDPSFNESKLKARLKKAFDSDQDVRLFGDLQKGSPVKARNISDDFEMWGPVSVVNDLDLIGASDDTIVAALKKSNESYGPDTLQSIRAYLQKLRTEGVDPKTGNFPSPSRSGLGQQTIVASAVGGLTGSLAPYHTEALSAEEGAFLGGTLLGLAAFALGRGRGRGMRGTPVTAGLSLSDGRQLVMNPSIDELKRMSMRGEAKLFQTKEGNVFAYPFDLIGEDSFVHKIVADELKMDTNNIGFASFRPNMKELPSFKDKNDAPFRTYEDAASGAYSSPRQPEIDSLIQQKNRLSQELADMSSPAAKARIASASGDIRNQELMRVGQRTREINKELRKLKDKIDDLEALKIEDALRGEAPVPKPKVTLENTVENKEGVYARVEFPLEEMGFYNQITDTDAKTNIGRFVLGGRQLASEDLFGLSVRSVSRRNKILADINNYIVPKFQALKPRERGALASITEVGEEAGRWYTKQEFDTMLQRADLYEGTTPDRMFEAYSAYKMFNDTEYTLRNDEVFSIKNAQGFQTARVEGLNEFLLPEQNARIARALPGAQPAGRTYNASEGYHFTNSDLRWNPKRFEDEGFVLVQLDRPFKMDVPEGTVWVHNVLARKADTMVSPLRNVQINYRAGGHRMYSPKVRWFSKQASVHKQADTGEEFLGPARTWKGGVTREDLLDWTDRHNRGLEIWRRHRAGEFSETNARLLLNDIVDDVDDFVNDIQDGHFNLNEPLEVVGDRQLPSAYAKADRPIFAGADDTMPGGLSNMETQGRMYYSPKGDAPLTDAKGNQLPRLDVFETTNRTLGNIANLIGFGAYKERAMQKWLATYGPYLNTGNTASPGRVFLESTFRNGTPDSIRFSAEQERSVIRRVLNWTTPGGLEAQAATRSLIKALEDGDTFLGKTMGKKVSAIVRGADENEFLNQWRGAVFDIKLGLFNVAQFPMQITTMLAASSIDPTNGFQAMTGLLPLRSIVRAKEVLDVSQWADLRKRVGETPFGFSSFDDYQDMATELRNGGFLELNSSQAWVNDFSTSNAFNLTGNKLQDVREKGRSIFYESERWNRLVAWQMGWKWAQKHHGNLPRQEFLEKVYQRAEDLSLNMTEASSAQWQKGILSIPTQFWAYQNRMLEAAFGRQFTVQEKIRLIAGQSILYGSVGIPGIAWLSEHIQGKSGEALELGKDPAAYLDRGLIDTVIHAATGEDVLFSERAGIGHFHTDVVRELFNMGRYGDSSAFENLTGASGSIGLQVASDTQKFFGYLAAEAGHGQLAGPLTQAQLVNVARNISTVNNSLKAYTLWKHGILSTSDGKIIWDEGTKGDAFAAALGIPLGEQRELSARMAWMRDRGKSVDDAAKVIANYRVELASKFPDGTLDVQNEMTLFIELLPEEIRFEAISQANRYTPDTVYDSVGRTLQKKKTQDERAK